MILIAWLTIATFFNILIIRYNLKKKRYENIAFDIGIIIALSILFKGTLTGMAVATSVSALWSITLIIKPIKLK